MKGIFQIKALSDELLSASEPEPEPELEQEPIPALDTGVGSMAQTYTATYREAGVEPLWRKFMEV